MKKKNQLIKRTQKNKTLAKSGKPTKPCEPDHVNKIT